MGELKIEITGTGISKTVQTRAGLPVRIYATDGKECCAVHGAYKDVKGNWVVSCWAADGRVYEFSRDISPSDLVPIPPREWWINVYETGPPCLHATKESADKSAMSSRIARVHVCEGQFDG